MGSSQLLGKAEEMLVGNLAIDWQVGVVIVLPSHSTVQYDHCLSFEYVLTCVVRFK